MKISLALGRPPLTREMAWGCLTTNLALPGCGSLLAGRRSGYGQLALTLAGMVVTTICGGKLIIWYFTDGRRFRGPDIDPIDAFRQLWLHLRWPLVGMGLFLVALLWAFITSVNIMNSTSPPAPPPIH